MKNIRFYPVTALVMYIVLSIVGALTIRGNTFDTVEGQYEEIQLADYLEDMQGYLTDGNIYQTDSEDPQLILDFTGNSGRKAYGIRLELEEDVALSNVQLFYGREDKVFAETDQHSFQGDESSVIEAFSPEGFAYVRLDINEDFAIREIQTSYEVQVHAQSAGMDYVIMLVINLVPAVLAGFLTCLEHARNKAIRGVKTLWGNAVKYRKSIVVDLLVCVAAAIVSYGMELVCMKLFHGDYVNKFRLLLIWLLMTGTYYTLRYRRHIWQHAGLYLFCLLMATGSLHIVSAPPSGGISWDDEIHYGKTAYLSYGANHRLSYSDYRLVNQYADVIYNKTTYRMENRNAWSGLLNGLQDEMQLEVYTDNYKVAVEYVAYIPAAVALAVGRGLGLSFTHNFMFGKFVNLLCYALIMSGAVRLLKKRGRILVTVLALIPTSLFIAAAYAYDWWVISLIVLGYAMFIHELDTKKVLSWKKFLGIMLVMILGIMPKAIYFPLIFPMMILRKKCYSNSKACRGMGVAAIGVLIFSFIMPMLAASGNIGDVSRANPGVDSMGQIQFILSQPLEYTKILLNYLASYLSPDTASEYLTNFAYYGKFSLFTVCMLVIGAACVLDNHPREKQVLTGRIFKTSVFVCAFGSIVLAVTALYISFTPVAYDTILGCQARYILPVLFPVLYYAGKMDLRVSERLSNKVLWVGASILAVLFLYGIYRLGIHLY